MKRLLLLLSAIICIVLSIIYAFDLTNNDKSAYIFPIFFIIGVILIAIYDYGTFKKINHIK